MLTPFHYMYTQQPFTRCTKTLYKLSNVCLPQQYNIGLYSLSDKTYLGLHSLSGRTSYRNISWSLEDVIFGVIMIVTL